MVLNTGTVVANRYEIIEKLGTGGMAIVYRAKDLKLDRDVTFKVMREEHIPDDEFISRFNTEARAAASLSNPNIVSVYDVGVEEDINYIVMEYVDGVTLKDLIKKRAPFENEETFGVAIQIATALSHAHKNNIIHRDIKPQNILVTAGGVVKVTDFGIARAATAATTTNTSTMGSVHYFSPEQARGKYVDVRSDIYSLGIVMYEMATGQIPFDGESAVAIALKHINEPLPDMKLINPNISESLNKIILKATNKLSSQRYETIDEMTEDLKRAITNSSGEFVNIEKGLDSPTIKLNDDEVKAIRFDLKETEFDEDDKQNTVEDFNVKGLGENKLDKETEKKLIIVAICTAVVIIFLIVFIGFREIRGRQPSQIRMPQLQGLTIEEAQEVLLDEGMPISIEVNEKFSDDVEPGQIISQNPEANARVAQGDSITIYVSVGPESVEMPNVVGLELPEAYRAFGSNTMFDIAEQRVFSEDHPVNTVVGQFPEAGETVSATSNITLFVSRGTDSRAVTVPNLTGLTEANAVNLINSMGLTLGNVSRSHSETVEEGLVVVQTISAGREVEQGTPIGIVVSSGSISVDQDNDETATEPEEENIVVAPERPATPVAPVTPVTREITFQRPANIPENVETVDVYVLKITGQGRTEIFSNPNMSVNAFPLTLPVQGTGQANVQLYINNSMVSQEIIDFS